MQLPHEAHENRYLKKKVMQSEKDGKTKKEWEKGWKKRMLFKILFRLKEKNHL